METRFGTKVTPQGRADAEGWIKVITEDGREREWHISEMRFESDEERNSVLPES